MKGRWFGQAGGFQSTKNDTSIEFRQNKAIYSQIKNFLQYSSYVFIGLKIYSAVYHNYIFSLSKV